MPPKVSNLLQMLQQAQRLHQSDRLADAEAIYRQVLAQDPNNPDALHLLGLLAWQVGRPDAAIELLQKAVERRPTFPEAYANLGNAYGDAGRIDEAIAACRMAIKLKKDFPQAYTNLGNALYSKGLFDQAIDAYRQAIRLKGSFPETHNGLGNALRDKGRIDEAIAAYRRAIELRKDYAQAHSNLGGILKDKGQLERAIAACRRAIELKPDLAHAYVNLGSALKDKNQLDEAIAVYRRAIELDDKIAEAHCNLGMALKEKGQTGQAVIECRRAIELKDNLPQAHGNLAGALLEQKQFAAALAACRKALEIKPDFAEAHCCLGSVLWHLDRFDEAFAAWRHATELKQEYPEPHYNMANALRDIGRMDESIAAARRAIGLRADYGEAHFSLALTLLLTGDFRQGFREYEWRWKMRDQGITHSFPDPAWRGEDLAGQTILLHAEQGLGDTIQFIRYAPLVKQHGGRVIVQCQEDLYGLLADYPGADQVIPRGRPLPQFQRHCPLLDIPLALGTDLNSIPSPGPYLNPNLQRVIHWNEAIAAHKDRLKIGLVWAGRPQHKNDHNRSIALAQLAPLADVPNAMFFSLQKGPAATQTPPQGIPWVDFTEQLTDFAETAALLANLDLVLTVDTSVAHLAGAMGKKVWVMLPFIVDWRWLLGRTDCPWYPTMRLFRQRTRGDWTGVIQSIAEQLRRL